MDTPEPARHQVLHCYNTYNALRPPLIGENRTDLATILAAWSNAEKKSNNPGLAETINLTARYLQTDTDAAIAELQRLTENILTDHWQQGNLYLAQPGHNPTGPNNNVLGPLAAPLSPEGLAPAEVEQAQQAIAERRAAHLSPAPPPTLTGE